MEDVAPPLPLTTPLLLVGERHAWKGSHLKRQCSAGVQKGVQQGFGILGKGSVLQQRVQQEVF